MRAGPRLLPVAIAALGVVAALKLGDLWFGFDGASAQSSDSQPSAMSVPVQSKDDEALDEAAQSEPQDAPPPALPPGEVERRILEQLAARRAALEDREEELRTREAVIAAAERRLDDRIDKFEQARERLLSLRAEEDAKDAEKIEALIGAYERMKAKDAAVIFNALDEDIMLAVASGMRTQALAGVLSEMQPEKARRLTTMLADREREGVPPASGE